MDLLMIVFAYDDLLPNTSRKVEGAWDWLPCWSASHIPGDGKPIEASNPYQDKAPQFNQTERVRLLSINPLSKVCTFPV